MGSFNFKSSGETREQQIINQLVQSQTPFGIKTPLREGTEEIYEMTYSLSQQVKDNLRNLILTNWGERLGLYDLGGNLRPLLTEFVSLEDFDTAAIERIGNAIKRWMPYVTPIGYSTVADTSGTVTTNTAVIRMTVTYSVPTLNIKQDAIELTLYVP